MDILNSTKHILLNKTFKSTSYQRSLPSSEEHSTTIDDINSLTSSKQRVIKFLMEKNVIHNQYVCPKCGEDMKLCMPSSGHTSSDGYVWKCRKMVNYKRHEVERSLRKGSWLSDCNLTLEEIVKCIYYWTRDLEQQQVKTNCANNNYIKIFVIDEHVLKDLIFKKCSVTLYRGGKQTVGILCRSREGSGLVMVTETYSQQA